MLLRNTMTVFAILLFTCAAACNRATPASNSPAVTGIDIAGMDKSVKPGDGFNNYVNGGWLKVTEIPADKASYGIDAKLADETRKRTVDLIQGAANQAGNTGGDGQKVGDFYSSFMDETTIES